MAEAAEPKEVALAQDNATGYYQKAWLAAKSMNACNEVRLGVVMNYSVFLVDVMGRTSEAVKICSEAISAAEKIL